MNQAFLPSYIQCCAGLGAIRWNAGAGETRGTRCTPCIINSLVFTRNLWRSNKCCTVALLDRVSRRRTSQSKWEHKTAFAAIATTCLLSSLVPESSIRRLCGPRLHGISCVLIALGSIKDGALSQVQQVAARSSSCVKDFKDVRKSAVLLRSSFTPVLHQFHGFGSGSAAARDGCAWSRSIETHSPTWGY